MKISSIPIPPPPPAPRMSHGHVNFFLRNLKKNEDKVEHSAIILTCIKIIGLENQFPVILKMAVLHMFYIGFTQVLLLVVTLTRIS